ncbi:hypothetical protein [Geodermatophilus sp. URMC 63]
MRAPRWLTGRYRLSEEAPGLGAAPVAGADVAPVVLDLVISPQRRSAAPTWWRRPVTVLVPSATGTVGSEVVRPAGEGSFAVRAGARDRSGRPPCCPPACRPPGRDPLLPMRRSSGAGT